MIKNKQILLSMNLKIKKQYYCGTCLNIPKICLNNIYIYIKLYLILSKMLSYVLHIDS